MDDGSTPQVKQKRAYCKRGTGATAKKKRGLAAALGTTANSAGSGFSSSVTSSKKYVSKRELAAANAQGRYLHSPEDAAGAILVANQSCRLLADEERHVAALNGLLIASCELELELGDGQLLDGLIRYLGDPVVPLSEDDPMLPWMRPKQRHVRVSEWRDASADTRSPTRMGALTILRNLANVPCNRSRIAGHVKIIQALTAVLEPPLLGSTSAVVALEAVAGVCRCVELGGLYVEEIDEANIVPMPLRYRRLEAGWTTPSVARKLGAARALFRALRAAVAYSESSSAAFCIDGLRWVAIDDATEEHKRIVGLRALESLASVRCAESNFYLLTTVPDDLLQHAVNKFATRDSETRTFAVEFLALITEATTAFLAAEDIDSATSRLVPVRRLPCDETQLAGVRVARQPLLIDLALATIIATHHKFNDKPPVPIPEPPNRVSAFDTGAVAFLAAPISGGPLSAPHPPDISLAPLRSHRADTLRLLSILLANVAKLDCDAKARLSDVKTLLQPAAAADEQIADLIFNKL